MTESGLVKVNERTELAFLLGSLDDDANSHYYSATVDELLETAVQNHERSKLKDLIREYLIFVDASRWNLIVDPKKKELCPNEDMVRQELKKLQYRSKYWTRKDLDKGAQNKFDELIGRIKKLAKLVSNISLGQEYEHNIRAGLQDCFRDLFYFGNVQKKSQSLAKEYRRQVLVSAIAYMKHNYMRAHFEYLDFQRLTERKELLDKLNGKDPRLVARFHLAKNHFGGTGKDPYKVFVPAVDVNTFETTEFTPANVLIYECRKKVNENGRVDFGNKDFRNRPLSYHWYPNDDFQIDIGGPFDPIKNIQRAIYVSLKKEIPLYYFTGDDRTQKERVRNEKAVLRRLEVKEVHRLTNDQSFFLIFADLINRYFHQYVTVMKDKFLTAGEKGREHLDMMINACKYIDNLSAYSQADLVRPGSGQTQSDLFHSKELRKLRDNVKKKGLVLKDLLDTYFNIHRIKNDRDKEIVDLDSKLNLYDHYSLLKKFRNLLLRQLQDSGKIFYINSKPNSSWNSRGNKHLSEEDIEEIGSYEDFKNFIHRFLRSNHKQFYQAPFLPKFISLFFENPKNDPNQSNRKQEFEKQVKALDDYNKILIERHKVMAKAAKVLSGRHSLMEEFINFLKAATEMVTNENLLADPNLYVVGEGNKQVMRQVGAHYRCLDFHFTSDAFPDEIVVRQTYSHMKEIHNFEATRIDLDSGGFDGLMKRTIGILGTNGYSTGPHLHITSKWYFSNEGALTAKRITPATLLNSRK